MFLEKLYRALIRRTPEEIDQSPMFGSYGDAVMMAMKPSTPPSRSATERGLQGFVRTQAPKAYNPKPADEFGQRIVRRSRRK